MLFFSARRATGLFRRKKGIGMEKSKPQLSLYVALIALLISVVNIFLGVLPTAELIGKLDAVRDQVAATASKSIENASQIQALMMRCGKGVGKAVKASSLKTPVQSAASINETRRPSKVPPERRR